MLFTVEELREIAIIDAQIDATFRMTPADYRLSDELDRLFLNERLSPRERARRQYEKEWKAAHRVQEKARQKAWREVHREELNAKLREYRAKHREEINARERARYAQRQAARAGG